MYNPPPSDDFGLDRTTIEDKTTEIDNLLDRAQAENLSVKNVVARQEQLKRLFAWLIGIGLGIGVITAIALTIAITKLGLAKKPYEIENQPVLEEVQEKNSDSFEVPKEE